MNQTSEKYKENEFFKLNRNELNFGFNTEPRMATASELLVLVITKGNAGCKGNLLGSWALV